MVGSYKCPWCNKPITRLLSEYDLFEHRCGKIVAVLPPDKGSRWLRLVRFNENEKGA